ncbi:MAG: HdeD family acid-resistance protein [Ktedonobacteraceae bacterium]|nr:HdeD family acid-resistance protein [Ktedonobacteraceae bacterium]
MSVLTGSRLMRQYWWSLLIRGIVAILFGLAALFWPRLTLLVLVTLFGAFALIDGIVAVFVSLQERETAPRWWMLLLEGLAGIIIGLVTFFWPGITAFALLYLIAAWAIITGIFEIAAGFAMNRAFGFEWTLIIVGILSVLLGIFLAFQPVAGLLAIVWVIGIYALIAGILLIVRAFQFRSLVTI